MKSHLRTLVGIALSVLLLVWVLRDDEPVQVPVRIGATDGSYTEILGGELKEGDRVITGGGPRVTAPSSGQRRAGGGGGRGG